MNTSNYIGGELELFSKALTWKCYWMSEIRTFICGNVLEVGAGIGSNTMHLALNWPNRWICLEPDANLAARIRENVLPQSHFKRCEVIVGTLQTMEDLSEGVDTILYIDVLEHINDDKCELRNAADRLKTGGRLIVLSPAHPWLFSPFDRAIGHYRRYTSRMLKELTPPSLRMMKCFYLDSVGLLASSANKLLLRQSLPTPKQIAAWDSYMVPVSRWLDILTLRSFGRSIIGIWEKK